jgi:4-oxalocrotonate tautomerase
MQNRTLWKWAFEGAVMNKNALLNDDVDTVRALIDEYFNGLHHADTGKLKAIFHPDTVLKAPGIRRSLNEWLELVKTRAVPAEQGSVYGYRLLSLDIVEAQAMVKVLCPLFDRVYIDYLGLLKEEGCWRIVNKMYADI